MIGKLTNQRMNCLTAILCIRKEYKVSYVLLRFSPYIHFVLEIPVRRGRVIVQWLHDTTPLWLRVRHNKFLSFLCSIFGYKGYYSFTHYSEDTLFWNNNLTCQ